VRVVIEEVMREEFKQFLGAAWGEWTPRQKGYRNGTSTSDLATSSGPIEALEVRRRSRGTLPYAGRMTRYSRDVPQVAEG
jgi:putative transposase